MLHFIMREPARLPRKNHGGPVPASKVVFRPLHFIFSFTVWNLDNVTFTFTLSYVRRFFTFTGIPGSERHADDAAISIRIIGIRAHLDNR
jgi:hypothetical protein